MTEGQKDRRRTWQTLYAPAIFMAGHKNVDWNNIRTLNYNKWLYFCFINLFTILYGLGISDLTDYNKWYKGRWTISIFRHSVIKGELSVWWILNFTYHPLIFQIASFLSIYSQTQNILQSKVVRPCKQTRKALYWIILYSKVWLLQDNGKPTCICDYFILQLTGENWVHANLFLWPSLCC